MIGAKEAVEIAKQQAATMLEQHLSSLEEIERESYKGREVWDITLSFARTWDDLSPLRRVALDPQQYKRFLIDVETGDLVAMKLREFTTQ
jgi:hypothetical protein